MAFISMGCAFAQDNSTDSDILNESAVEDSFNLQNDCESADIQKLSSPDSSNQVINITSDNYRQYFKGGTLQNTYAHSTFFIMDDMDGLGRLTIRANNVTINGLNHTLKNTVFKIDANNVCLNNITLLETEGYYSNDYAAVLIYSGDNVGLYNLNINYTALEDSDAFGIYSLGDEDSMINNLKIINCTVTLVGNNRGFGRDYAMRLEYSPNAIVANSTINSELSLRTVDFTGTTASLYSEFSLAVGISYCDNLVFDSNDVVCNVGVRPECAYPTLDAIFICDSKDCNFTNNTVYMSDFLTYKDIANYLYGLDIYRDDNLLIEGNSIRIETTGGAYAAGTAYPIQISGPASGVLIRYNDIYSRSNGPNIGIYSQNFNDAITAGAASYIINYGGSYSATLKGVVGEKVIFALNGKNIGSAITNAKGVATIKLTAKILKTAKAGTRNLIIKLSSNNYNPASKTVKIKINKEKTKIVAKKKTFKRKVKTKKYAITLKNSKGKAIKKVWVYIKIAKKTFKAKTNAKGKAVFKIKKVTKKRTYKAKITFKGNAYYKKATKTVKIKIK